VQRFQQVQTVEVAVLDSLPQFQEHQHFIQVAVVVLLLAVAQELAVQAVAVTAEYRVAQQE
jgi:hypothetical protein